MNHSKRFQGVRRRPIWVMGTFVLFLTLAGGGRGFGQSGTEGTTAPAAAPPAPRVEAIASMRDHAASVSPTTLPAHKQNYEFTVKGTDWVDTGVTLAAGEQATFTVTGTMTLADGRSAGADGLDRGWKDLLRIYPLNSAKVGQLIGRVSDMGASVPFAIGASGVVTMPTTGKLYLAVNATSDLDPTGSYTVKVKLAAAAKVTAAAAPTAPVSQLVAPQMFDDIPRRVTDRATPGGNPGDMVNFGLVGTKEDVEAAYKAAGWTEVDSNVQNAIVNGLIKTLNKEAYTEMPMSTLFLFGRPQDLSFARADPLMVAAERHHLRVWKTNLMVGGRPLWVGSATHDIGFEKDQRNNGVTHKIDPDIDKERKFLLDSFDAAGVFSSAAYVTPNDPLIDARTATGGSFHSDGRIVVMDLK
jgi:hypothetical protein